MKKFKKILSVLLVTVMVLAMSVQGFAATGTSAENENGSIKIENAVKGETYTIYRILELESYNSDSNAYSYKATADWQTFIESSTIKDVYVTIDDLGYVRWKDDADVAAFAELAMAAVPQSNDGSQTAKDATVEFTGLKLGYYLVDTSMGTLCSLNTTNPEAKISEKNEKPENVKTVQEDSNSGNEAYGNRNDADVGQIVNFKSTITAQAGAVNYVFHDKMEDGFEYKAVDNIVLISENGSVQKVLVKDVDYTITNSNLKDGCDFEVEFKDSFCNALKANDKIVISYHAVLNDNAIIAGNGNKNTSWLTYGNAQKTPVSETTTYTWNVKVFKFTATPNEAVKKGLAGAKFTLATKSNAGKNPNIQFVDKGNNVYEVCTIETCKDHEHVGSITTDSTGIFTIEGLDSDVYYLTETDAPYGYNKLKGDVIFKIDANGKVFIGTETETNGIVSITYGEQSVDEVQVENKTGAILPTTGGIGTTAFYAVGIVLMAGAVYFVVRRKRG